MCVYVVGSQKSCLSKQRSGDFPGGPAVKNPSGNAWDKGSIPHQGTKIPHAVVKLSLLDTSREPVLHS